MIAIVKGSLTSNRPLPMYGSQYIFSKGFFIAWVVTLVCLAPRSTPEFVFQTNSFGLSGWTSEGVQWCVGLLSAVFPLGGFDGVLHMSEYDSCPILDVLII